MKKLINLTILYLFLTGCGASYFSASTESCYETPAAKICYRSTKNQEDFKAKVSLNPDGTLKDLDIQTSAVTAESAIAAASKSLAAMADTLLKLLPLLEKAALAGS